MQECNDKYVITLSSVNAEADKLNKEELDKLDTPAFTYEALIEKEFNEKKYPVKKSLTLKVGAQVMMCRNDSAKDGPMAASVSLPIWRTTRLKLSLKMARNIKYLGLLGKTATTSITRKR